MCFFIQLDDNGTRILVLPRIQYRIIFDPHRSFFPFPFSLDSLSASSPYDSSKNPTRYNFILEYRIVYAFENCNFGKGKKGNANGWKGKREFVVVGCRARRGRWNECKLAGRKERSSPSESRARGKETPGSRQSR